MKPRADFACLNKACQAEDGATVYELPVDAKVCPYGHRRIARIWTPPGILRSGARDMQKVIDQAGSEAIDRQTALRDARLNHEKAGREIAAANGGRPVPNLAMPLNKILPTLQRMGMREGNSTPTPTVSSPLLAGTVARRRPVPNVQKAWTPTPDEMKKAGG